MYRALIYASICGRLAGCYHSSESSQLVQIAATLPGDDSESIEPEQIGTAALTHFVRLRPPTRYWTSTSLQPRDIDRNDVATDAPIVLPVIEESGDKLRVVVEDERARIAVWVERRHAQPAVLGRIQLGDENGRASSTAGVWVKPGAPVKIVRTSESRVYIELTEPTIQASGWIPRSYIGKVWAGPASVAKSERWSLRTPSTVHQLDRESSTTVAAVRGDVPVLVIKTMATWSEVEIENEWSFVRGFVPTARLMVNTKPAPSLVQAAGDFSGPDSIPPGSCLFAGITPDEIVGVTIRHVFNFYPSTGGWWWIRVNSPFGTVEVFAHFPWSQMAPHPTQAAWIKCPRAPGL